MRSKRSVGVLCGLMLLFGTAAALAQDGGGPEGGGPPGGRPRPEGRPDGRPPGAERGLPFVGNFPAIRDEIQRHTEAIKEIMGLPPKPPEGAGEKGALKRQPKDGPPPPPQGPEVAGKLADEFALHFQNMASIMKDNRDAIVKTILDNMAKRKAARAQGGEGKPRRRPGAEGGPGGAPNNP